VILKMKKTVPVVTVFFFFKLLRKESVTWSREAKTPRFRSHHDHQGALCLLSCKLYLRIAISKCSQPAELRDLGELYNATNGADWDWDTVGSHWVFTPTANPCKGKWQGITCLLPSPGTTYYVSEISLSSYNLVGTMPDSIGVFSHMSTLELSTNQVTGTIPASVSNLTQLLNLNLESNQLEGTIPAALGSLGNLTLLSLSSNQLKGTIPATLGSLSQLTFLSLCPNQLTGTIPAALGSSSRLIALSLDYNELESTTPAALGSLTNLTALYLDFNLLEGTISSALGSLSQLTFPVFELQPAGCTMRDGDRLDKSSICCEWLVGQKVKPSHRTY
jgi:hypothetical protein